jgi:hypothetical protein
MTTVQDMLNCKLVRIGDTVEFTFKNNHFTSKILRGGLFAHCMVKRNHSESYEKILTNVSSFSSLTAWTEACLQDILDEYYTRYSSWKRVTHFETRQSMSELRDRCKLTGTVSKDNTCQLFKELKRLYEINREMANYINQTNGSIKRTWGVIPRAKLNKHLRPPDIKKRKLTHEEAFNRIQHIITNNVS